MKKIIYIFAILSLSLTLSAQDPAVIINDNAVVYINTGLDVIVNGDVQLETGSTVTQESGSHFYLPGNLENNGSIVSNSSFFTFQGSQNLTITGSGSTQFSRLNINFDDVANSLNLFKNTSVTGDLYIITGIFDLSEFEADKTVANGTFDINAECKIRFGGTNGPAIALANYSVYDFDFESITEFYGTDQFVSYDYVPFETSGYGIVYLFTPGGIGDKYVDDPTIVKNNLYIQDAARLVNGIGVDALSVRRNVINSSSVYNQGIIEIGE